MSLLMELPEEVRVAIFNQVPQHDLVHNVRLVCQQWRREIDELCDFSVEIDDRKLGWERILQLRIRSCKVIHFTKPPPNGPSTTILSFPNIIRSLKIYENISPVNFFYLLGDCARGLRKLKLFIGHNLVGFDFPTSFETFNFEKLEHLDIRMSTVADPRSNSIEHISIPPFLVFGSAQSKMIELIFTQFLSNRLSSLKSLKLNLRCVGFSEVSHLMGVTLSFLSNHYLKLKIFDFELILGHGLPSSEFRPLSDSDASNMNTANLKKLDQLKMLKIVSSSPVGVNFWIDFLSQQKCLNFLEVDILPAPSSVFRDVITRNYENLMSIEITDLTVWDEDGNCTPFDMTVFQNCRELKKLTLDRNVTRRRVMETSELINLFNLPENLDELALNYFNVLSDELIVFVNSQVGHNLKTLYLTQCGSSDMHGVDGTVLQAIIGLPKITFIEISPLNFSDPEERDRLNIILETFGYSSGHSYFQLAKTTQEIPVRFHFFVETEDDEDEETDGEEANENSEN